MLDMKIHFQVDETNPGLLQDLSVKFRKLESSGNAANKEIIMSHPTAKGNDPVESALEMAATAFQHTSDMSTSDEVAFARSGTDTNTEESNEQPTFIRDNSWDHAIEQERSREAAALDTRLREVVRHQISREELMEYERNKAGKDERKAAELAAKFDEPNSLSPDDTETYMKLLKPYALMINDATAGNLKRWDARNTIRETIREHMDLAPTKHDSYDAVKTYFVAAVGHKILAEEDQWSEVWRLKIAAQAPNVTLAQQASQQFNGLNSSPYGRSPAPSPQNTSNIAPPYLFDAAPSTEKSSYPLNQTRPVSPGSASSQNAPSHEALMQQNDALRTRVSELEVINGLMHNHVQQKAGQVTQIADLTAQDTGQSLQELLDISRQREDQLKSRVEELQREVIALRQVQSNQASGSSSETTYPEPSTLSA